MICDNCGKMFDSDYEEIYEINDEYVCESCYDELIEEEE